MAGEALHVMSGFCCYVGGGGHSSGGTRGRGGGGDFILQCRNFFTKCQNKTCKQ